MAKFIADSSIEPAILEIFKEYGHSCKTQNHNEALLVDKAMKTGSILVSRSTAYADLLAVHKKKSPCLIWIGPPKGSPMIANLFADLLENKEDRMQKGSVIMMLPGRIEVLPVS